MQGLSERMDELAQGIKSLQNAVNSAGTKDRENLAKLVEQAQRNATRHADELRTRLHSSWDNVRQTARAAAKNMRADFTVARAENRADGAEADAILAVNVARAAVQEAEYAVLDAALARAEANDAIAGV